MSFNQPGDARYGVHSVDHFALEVPSLTKAQHFFEAFGLDVGQRDGSLELRTTGNDHVWARLFEGRAKRMAYLSLACWADEFDALAAQVLANGGTRVDSGPYVDREGLWFNDPDGNLLQLKPGAKRTPSGLAPRNDVLPRAGRRSVLGRSETAAVRPRRLSHLMLFSSNLDRSIAFFRDALGLRLSDRSRDAVAFMHARHGSDHHLVAFAASSARGWHHSSWDVDGVDAVGKGGEQMRKAGYTEGWGTGRHVLGSNFFHYVRDPWGSFAEFSADIDFIPTGMPWPGGDYPPEDSLYLWGPELPPYFIENGEA
ncbi:MAG: VOC family protein [Proteobacteria bacterium]|nr:VOC family protein [Pseudomonadota bacterium]